MTQDDSAMPLPLEEADGDEAMNEIFGPEGPTPFTPLGSAMLFWTALIRGRQEYLTALQQLSANPADWGDYSEVEGALKARSVAQNVDFPDGYEDLVGYVRFIPEVAQSAKAFADAVLDDVMVLTMVKGGNVWRVWGFSHNSYPPPDRIFDF